MLLLLQDLPSELIDAILSFDSVTHKSLALFLCGSKTLNRKLFVGVRSVEFKVEKEFVLVAIPSYLTFLRSLCVLRIQAHHQISRIAFSAKILRSLSPTLVSFEIRGQKAVPDDFALSLLVDPPISGFAPPVYAPAHYNVASVFPALETLVLPTNCSISAPAIITLPESLTELSCSLDYVVEPILYKALPKSFKHLRLHMPTDVAHWHLLPPNLQTFATVGSKCGAIPPEYLKTLPQTLTQSIMGGSKFSLSYVSSLPPGVKNMTAYSTKETDIESLFRALPPQLEWLGPMSVREYPISAIRLLPKTVSFLGTCFNIDGMLASDLPPRLTHLTISGTLSKFTVENARVLPPTLTELNIASRTLLMHEAMPHLPAALRLLEATLERRYSHNLNDFETVSYPPNVETLTLNGDLAIKPPASICSTFDFLHQSVLCCCVLPTSFQNSVRQFAEAFTDHRLPFLVIAAGLFKARLPHTLRTLEMSTYNLPYSAVSNLPDQLQVLLVLGIYDDEGDQTPEPMTDASPQAHSTPTSVLARLPRSLTSLVISLVTVLKTSNLRNGRIYPVTSPTFSSRTVQRSTKPPCSQCQSPR